MHLEERVMFHLEAYLRPLSCGGIAILDQWQLVCFFALTANFSLTFTFKVNFTFLNHIT